MDFYCKAFGGRAVACMEAPDGSVVHGEVVIGNSTLMLSQENPQWELKSAETLGGSPVSLHIYTDDCEALFQRAIAAGCAQIMPCTEMFWGDRYGKLVDPFGITWGIATHIEDVEPDEMKRRSAEWFASMASGECQDG
jgi:PhnB protein